MLDLRSCIFTGHFYANVFSICTPVSVYNSDPYLRYTPEGSSFKLISQKRHLRVLSRYLKYMYFLVVTQILYGLKTIN